MPRGRKRRSSVAEAAIADLKQQKEAYEKRRQVLAGNDLPLTPERHPREHPWPEDYMEAMCRPVRFTVSFDDLPRCAKQIRMLTIAVGHAKTILYDLNRSQQKKRFDLRFVMKRAAEEIAEVDSRRQGKR